MTIRPNTNTLFGLLFRPNRIRIEYSVQPYSVVFVLLFLVMCSDVLQFASSEEVAQVWISNACQSLSRDQRGGQGTDSQVFDDSLSALCMTWVYWFLCLCVHVSVLLWFPWFNTCTDTEHIIWSGFRHPGTYPIKPGGFFWVQYTHLKTHPPKKSTLLL